MNNNKKLEQIMQQIDEAGLPVENVVSYLLLMQQIDESGLTSKDIVSYLLFMQQVDKTNLRESDGVPYLLETGRLKPDGSKILPQETSPSEYKTPSEILPGMYVYADGLIHPEFIKGRQVKAVVGYVDGSEVLAVCRRMTMRPFASNEYFKQTADQWCHDYAEDGVKQGEARLPSLEQLKKLYEFHKATIPAWRTLGVKCPFINFTWSSTPRNYDHTWTLDFSYFGMTFALKNYCLGCVRPVISIRV